MSSDSIEAALGETGGEGNSGQRPNEDVPHFDVVTDGQADIAKSQLYEKIVVGVPGRQHFQRIYVRKSGAGGKTTVSYKPAEDAPAANNPVSILPTKEEIESRAETMEFLVVGLVLADNPLQYSTQGSGRSRNKKRDEERVARGVLPAERNVLRAIVPITDFISTSSIKYYVACNQLHGLCNMRVITGDAIFFFQEIWDGIPESLDVKERRSQVGAACKKHAARDKKPPQRALIPVSAKPGSTPSNLITITPTVNAANLLLMQYSVFAVSKQPSAIHALKKTLENILPDLCRKPSDEGVLGFYDFESDLAEEDAVKAVNAIKITYPNIPTLDPTLVLELHAALRRTGLGGKLPYQSFAAFLRWGHDRATAGWASEKLDTVVRAVIHDIGIANEIQEITTTRTVSKVSDGPTDLNPFLSGLRVALNEIVHYFKAQATALREQHGGVTNHASIDNLMIKIGNCVDKTALASLEEQVFAIHAEQLATANSNGVGYIEACIALIDRALGISA